MRKLLLAMLLTAAAGVWASPVFTESKYDATQHGFNQKSAGILDPQAGEISFKFTGSFDRFKPGSQNVYMLFYSGSSQLGVQQLRKNRFRLFFHSKNMETNKPVGVEKVVPIVAGKPFSVKLLWDKSGAKLFFNGNLLGVVPVRKINWSNTFAFGGMSKGLTYRLAGGIYENIVISNGDAAPVAAGTLTETFKLDKLDAPGERIESAGIINPLGGEISFDFTGNFSRPSVAKKLNTYPLFISGKTQIGINQLSSGKLRLFFHFHDGEKNGGVEGVAPIEAGKKFSVRLLWGNGEGQLFLNGKLFRKFAMKQFFSGTKFFFGGLSVRPADGVLENIVIKAAPCTPAPEVAGAATELKLDFENDDIKDWTLDKADGSEQRIFRDDVNAFSGKFSLRVEKLNFLGDFEYIAPAATRMQVKKGVSYELRTRYRLESITDAAVSGGFIFENEHGRIFSFTPVVGAGRRSLRHYHRNEAMLPEKRWREFTKKFTAPADGFIRFAVNGGEGVFKCNFDSVSARKLVATNSSRVFFEDFSTLNIRSADALAGRDFRNDGVRLVRNKRGLQLQFPGALVWESEKLNPLVEYRMTIDSAKVSDAAVVTLEFRDAAEKLLARYERPLASPCFLDFEVPATASLSKLAITGKSGSAVIHSIAVDKNFTVNRERAIYNNEWQGYAIWDGEDKGKTVIRRTFELDAVPKEGYVRFLGHNGATLFVNGQVFGKGGQFAPGVADVSKTLKAGKNVITLLVSCSSGGKKGMFELYARDVNAKEYFLVSDNTAKVFAGVPEGNWMDPDYDDSGWANALVRDGSARDFGNSATAAIVNNRREIFYIGPRELFKVSNVGYTREFPADGVMNIDISGGVPDEIRGGRVIFTRGKQIFRLALADKEITVTPDRLSVAFAPMFMPPGKYECALELYRVRFADGVCLKLGDVTIAPKAKPFRRPVAKIKPLNGKAILHINGKPHPSGIYCTGRPYCPEVREMNDQVGIKVHQIYINMRATQPFIANADMIDDRSGKYDLSVTEQILVDAAAQLRHDPDAYIFPLICNGVPKDFSSRDDRQDDLLVTGKGNKLWIHGKKRVGKFGQPYKDMSEIPADSQVAVSHASQNKIKVYTDMIRATVEYFENSPIAEKIIGYGVSGEMDNQLYPYMPYGGAVNQLGRGDYSPVMLRYFRNFLKEKYGSDRALQEAWQDENVTLTTAQIPPDHEREGVRFFVSPAVADYVSALGMATLDMTSSMTGAIKEVTGGRCLTWLYPCDNAGLDGVMHFGYHALTFSSGYRQYTEKSVDLFGNPGNYNMRRNGLSSSQYGAPGSARLNNKIWSPEFDLRSFVIGAYSTSWGPDSLFASRAHWSKEMMTTLRYGAGFRIYTFWPGWLNNAGIMDEVAILQNISRQQLTLPVRWKPEVCLLHDTTGLEHTGDFTNRKMHFYLGAVGGFCASELLTSGAALDIYYLQDILRDDFPADQYKVYVINQAYRVDEKMRYAITAKLRGKGKTVIWRWGAGYLNKYNQPDAAEVEKLTGFKVKPYQPETALPPAVVKKEVFPWTAGMKNSTVAARFRYNTNPALPYFILDDRQAQILANFPGGEAVLGVKQLGGGISIYAALPALPARMLRNIYAAAGVHTYVDNEHDFVSTDGNFISLHSGVGGVKNIKLPEKVAQIINVHTGKVVAENADALKFDLRANGTAIFRLVHEKSNVL